MIAFHIKESRLQELTLFFIWGFWKFWTRQGAAEQVSLWLVFVFFTLTTPTKSQVIQTPHWPPLTNIKETQKEKCKQAQKQDLKMKKTTKTQMRQASYTCDLVAVLITHGWIQSFEPPSSQGENLSLAWLSSNPSGRLKEHSGRVKVKVNPRKKVSSRERKRNL